MVTVQFQETDSTLHLSCKGHAGYAKTGQPDIVCAAVSALSMTLCNALVHCPGFHCKVNAGNVSLSCDTSDEAQTIFRVILIGFHGLEAQYPNHVAIDTRERPLKGESYVHI